jgi:glycerophosphoryl diester phosphodiesterase
VGIANPCCAHRGASGLAPENTMAAMKKALTFPFVEWIELDVQLSKDGVPVVMHDDTVNRTTDRKGRVADFTAAELASMDAGSWFSPEFRGEPVPTLEQVLELTAGKCRLNIELKTYGGRYPGIEAAVVGLLRRHDRIRNSVITSFDPLALRRVKEAESAIQTGLIIDAAPPGLEQALARIGAAFLSIGWTRLTAERMAAFRKAGLEVMAWTVDRKPGMRRIAAMGEDIIICTNYPDRFGELKAGRKFKWFGR